MLVLKKLSAESFIGVPLSTQEKIGSWFIDIAIRGEKRYALLYQIRMFSANFQRRLATLDDADLARVKEKLETLPELSNHHQGDDPRSVGNPKSNSSLGEAETEVKAPELSHDKSNFADYGWDICP